MCHTFTCFSYSIFLATPLCPLKTHAPQHGHLMLTSPRLWPNPSSLLILFSVSTWSTSTKMYILVTHSTSSPDFSFVLQTFHPFASLISLLDFFLKNISNILCPKTKSMIFSRHPNLLLMILSPLMIMSFIQFFKSKT